MDEPAKAHATCQRGHHDRPDRLGDGLDDNRAELGNFRIMK